MPPKRKRTKSSSSPSPVSPREVQKVRSLRAAFKYGIEYETLVYSPLIQAEYLNAKTASVGKTYADNRCGFLDFDSNTNTNFKSTPYRKIMQNLFGDDFAFEWYNGKLCPATANNNAFQEPYTKWAITYDGSVTNKAVGSFIGPLYRRIEDLLSPYPQIPEDPNQVIDFIEIVSPPLTRASVEAGELQRIFTRLSQDGRIQYYNNPKTSNHMHMTCDQHLRDPHVLYNLYVTWMIAEPLILMALPYWRRNNERYAQSIYSALKSRPHDVRAIYSTLINLKHNTYTTELYTLFSQSPKHYLRSVDKAIARVLGAVRVPSRMKNKEIFDSKTDVPILILSSIFQDYIGKPDKNGQYKNNIARYAAFNCLNMLNTNAAARTVEVRIKHGSDDPDEIQGYLNLFTELAIVAIMKGNSGYHLSAEDLDIIISANQLIVEQSTLLQLDDDTFKKLQDKLLNIVDKHVFKGSDKDQTKARDFMLAQIRTMRDVSKTASTGVGGAKTKREKTMPTRTTATTDKTWVFCYGSNGMEQLRERVGHVGPWTYRPVVLKGYARIFSGYSGTWKGGVASIWPSPKHKVYGSIVQMTATEIKKLDKYEGVGTPGWYYQEDVVVHDAITGKEYKAMGYIKEDMEMTDVPSVKYLQSIELNLKAAGLKPRQVGTALKIYGIPDLMTMKLTEIGKWEYGAAAITFKTKRLAKQFAT